MPQEGPLLPDPKDPLDVAYARARAADQRLKAAREHQETQFVAWTRVPWWHPRARRAGRRDLDLAQAELDSAEVDAVEAGDEVDRLEWDLASDEDAQMAAGLDPGPTREEVVLGEAQQATRAAHEEVIAARGECQQAHQAKLALDPGTPGYDDAWWTCHHAEQRVYDAKQVAQRAVRAVRAELATQAARERDRHRGLEL